jgi:hypothetical protein
MTTCRHGWYPILSLFLCGGVAMSDAVAQTEFRPRLLQAELETAVVPAGGSFAVTYWWQNTGSLPADSELRVFVHLRREGEAESLADGVRLGADHDPALPTYRWRPDRLVSYSARVPIPTTLPPGEYLLLVGLFDPLNNMERRPLELPPDPNQDGHRYLLARFRVTPAGEAGEPAPLRRTFFPLPQVKPETSRPPPPARTITLGGPELTLVLDAESPRPLAWRVDGHDLGGDPEGEAFEVRVLVLAENRVRGAHIAPQQLTWTLRQESATRAVYHAEARLGTARGVEFDLGFAVTGSTAAIVLSDVVEHPGCQLVTVRHGRLVSASDGARLAVPANAGRLVDPTRSAPCERTFSMDWFNPVLAGAVHDRHALCALDVPGVDDRLLATVGEGWAALGAALEHREPATPPLPSLLLSESATVRLRFLAPAGRAPDWTDGARLLRAEVTAQPPPLYDQAMIYKIFCDSPGAPNFTTFEQALDLVRRVRNLTDAAPQVVYLVGFQHRGHDTGYPDVFTANPRLGGHAALLAAMKEAEPLNAILSFHDNYDDAYEHSPGWNPAFIARDRSGGLMQGGVWAGGQSYILSFPTYGPGPGRERVRRTLALYPIRGSYHIDVLSAVPRRLDFNPANPASGTASLAGKLAIIAEFNRHGIDVTSEGFCAPFVGHLGHAWHLQRQAGATFQNDERIPFVPFIFHGHATWGGARAGREDIPDALIYGATFSSDFTRFTPPADLTDSYYLLTLPWTRLRTREMTGYRVNGALRRVDYGPDSYVEADSQGQHYRVVVDGRLLAEDFATLAPNAKGDAWLAYSQAGGALDFPAPPEWTNAAQIRAVTLTADGPGGAVSVRLEAGRLRLDLPPATPCRLSP